MASRINVAHTRRLVGIVLSILLLLAATPAQAAGNLQWRLEQGRFLVTLPDKTEWQGPMPARVTWSDDKGPEQASPVEAASGWTVERTPDNHLACQNAKLGLSFRIELTATADTLTVRVPAASIQETGPARLRTLRLLPRFAAAAEGDSGHLVIPQQSGVLCNFRGKTAGEHPVSIYQNIAYCPMPLFGTVRPDGAIAAIITSGQFDARLIISTNYGTQHLYAIDPSFTLRSFAAEQRLAEDLAVEYRFLPRGSDWIAIAKTYRAFNFERRGLRPLRQRVPSAPSLAYSARALQVRIRLGVKPVPTPVLEQTPETEPPLRIFCTFERVRHILDEFHRQGIARAEVCLVGWNRGGHDGRFPQVFPVEPALGGEEQLRATIRHGQSLGYQIIAHDCWVDAYRIAEDWSEDHIRRKPDGSLHKGGAFGGGQSYNLCLTRADALFASRDLPRTRALGFAGSHYSDVLSILGPRPCYDSRHPQTRRQDAEAANRIMARAREIFGAVQSEGPLDFSIPVLDRALYVDWEKWHPLDKRPYFDACVPLFQVVYHGVLLYNRSAGAVNSGPGETFYLQNIEFGGTPVAYFYGHFILDESKNWLGKKDRRYDSPEQLRQNVAELRRVVDDFQQLEHLQLEFIEGHRPLAPAVFETLYSNGQRVVVNYAEQSFKLPCGAIVPPQAFLLLPNRP